jgi:aconitase A
VILFFDSGLPAILDLAAMRDAAVRLGVDPLVIQPKVSTTLLLDYYNIEADVARKYWHNDYINR